MQVRDSTGHPSDGPEVTFTVTSGDARLVAGVSRVTVRADTLGRAMTTVVLGTTPGPVLVTATSGTLPAVAFQETTTLGAPARVTAVAGIRQAAPAYAAVDTVPLVLVTDAVGNPVGNVPVTFTVTAGGGRVDGGPTAITDGGGRASLTAWTLGALGAQRVSATVAGLPPAVFDAVALSPCGFARAYTMGTVVVDTLRETDCNYTDSWSKNAIKQYALTLTSAQPLSILARDLGFHERTGGGTTVSGVWYWVSDSSGRTVADAWTCNDGPYVPAGGEVRNGGLLRPGTYVLSVTACDGDYVGAFQFSARQDPAFQFTCDQQPPHARFYMGIMRGVSGSQRLDPVHDGTGCEGWRYASNPHDEFSITLSKGETITVEVQSPDLTPYVSVRVDPDAPQLARAQAAGPGATTTLTFTATNTQAYWIWVGGLNPLSDAGAYTITVR